MLNVLSSLLFMVVSFMLFEILVTMSSAKASIPFITEKIFLESFTNQICDNASYHVKVLLSAAKPRPAVWTKPLHIACSSNSVSIRDTPRVQTEGAIFFALVLVKFCLDPRNPIPLAILSSEYFCNMLVVSQKELQQVHVFLAMYAVFVVSTMPSRLVSSVSRAWLKSYWYCWGVNRKELGKAKWDYSLRCI